MIRVISSGLLKLVGPGVDDRVLVEVVHGCHDAVLELFFGGDPDVTQHRAGEFGEEALDEVEPGAVGWREGELETARLCSEPSLGFFGDVGGMIVQDQPNRSVSRVGGIDELKELDELAAAMPLLD